MKSKSNRQANVMRSTIVCGLVLLSLSLFGQNNNYYWYKGTKIPLEPIDNKKFVLFKSDNADSTLAVLPFFSSPNGGKAGLSHLFYVRLHKEEDIYLLEEFAKKNNVEILGNNYFMPLWYTLVCTKRSIGNAMEIANSFYESGKFSAAEPHVAGVAALVLSVNPYLIQDQVRDIIESTAQYKSFLKMYQSIENNLNF